MGLYNQVVLPAVIQSQSGLRPSSAIARKLVPAFIRFFGLQRVRLTDRGVAATLNVSRLRWDERECVQWGLRAAINCVVETSDHFHPALVMNALEVAFNRAEDAR